MGELRNANRQKLTADQIHEKVKMMRDRRLKEKKLREVRDKKKQEEAKVIATK